MIKYNLRLETWTYLEEYRSGHNEAVLKTVCPQGHGGSNPSSSAEKDKVPVGPCLFQLSSREGFEQGATRARKREACDEA